MVTGLAGPLEPTGADLVLEPEPPHAAKRSTRPMSAPAPVRPDRARLQPIVVFLPLGTSVITRTPRAARSFPARFGVTDSLFSRLIRANEAHKGREPGMSVTPSIDYMCPNCGAKATYKLVPMMEEELRPEGESPVLPSLDFTCARCGTRQIYMLSPVTPST